MSKSRNTSPFQFSSSHDGIYNLLTTFNDKKELGSLARTSKLNNTNVHKSKTVDAHLQTYSEALRALALHKDIAGKPSIRIIKDEKMDAKLVFPDAKTVNSILNNKEDLLITRLNKLYNQLREPLQIYVRNTNLAAAAIDPLGNFPEPLTSLLRLEPFIRGIDNDCSETLRGINQTLHESFVDSCFDDDDATIQLSEEKVFTALEALGGVDAADRLGTTCLINCCREEIEADDIEQNIPIIRSLLKNGANPNARNSRGETPLLCAINEKSVEKTWLLLTHGAKIDNLSFNNMPILIKLVTEESYHPFFKTILPYLKYYQANLDPKDQHGQNALMHAIAYGHNQIARALIEQAANINAADNNGETVLMKAIMRSALFNHGEVTPMIRFLLAKGVDVLAKNNKGKSAFDYAELYPELTACLNNHLAVVPYEPPRFTLTCK